MNALDVWSQARLDAASDAAAAAALAVPTFAVSALQCADHDVRPG